MKIFSYYLKSIFAWTWFLISFSIGLLLLPFQWKNVGITKIIGNIVYFGASKILGFKSTILNKEYLYQQIPCVYVCNHQSNFDILTMSHLYPHQTAVIGKKELFWIPIFGLFFYGAGHVLLDRKNKKNSIESLKAVVEEIKRRNISVWIFPEGTRNHGSSDLLPFKKGAFHLAIEAQIPIVPIIHQHLSSYYRPTDKYLFNEPTEIISKVLSPISTSGLNTSDVDKLLQQIREIMEKELTALNKTTGVNFIKSQD